MVIDMEKIRVQKIISDSGYCSRRQAEAYIEKGVVKVNGHVVKLGDKADARNDLVTINGEKINSSINLRYIKLYKPRGYVTTMSDSHGRKIITDLLSNVHERVYPIGRLDKNSEGLILLTNDGAFANAVMHPGHEIHKKYRVTIPTVVQEETIARLSAGVDIGEGVVTSPCMINTIVSGSKENPRTVLEFVISEGKNRQIRRMCEAVGLEVSRLRRTSIGGIKLGMLKPGEYADLSKEELRVINSIIRKNDNHNSVRKNRK